MRHHKEAHLQFPAEHCGKGEEDGALQVASAAGMKQVPAATMSQSGKRFHCLIEGKPFRKLELAEEAKDRFRTISIEFTDRPGTNNTGGRLLEMRYLIVVNFASKCHQITHHVQQQFNVLCSTLCSGRNLPHAQPLRRQPC